MKTDHSQSEVEIITKENYVLVKPPEGVNLWDIFATLGKFMANPEFQDKNDVWLFNDGSIGLNFSDLQKIIDLGKENLPENARGKKTAIVVSTGFQRGLAEMFAEIGKEHPRNIKVFADLKDAEDWANE